VHTPIQFYVRIPADLFRGGTPTKPKFDYLRTMPPRTADETYDVKIDPVTRMIDHTSGGLSLFDSPDFSFGPDWWVIPAGTELPPGFTVSKDLTNGKFKGHYTIRSMNDIHEDVWKRELASWANEHAVHIKKYRKASSDV
jgi:hypothetical protein